MTRSPVEAINLQSSDQQKACQEIFNRLRQAKKVIAFTGAGISQESGIPTFRGSDGLWEDHRIEDVATPQAFQSNPKLVWDFYLARRKVALAARPNSAHLAIADWEKEV